MARLWQLPDGTQCLLLKIPRADNWELRVVRDRDTLRTEHFSSPIVAMDEAKLWLQGGLLIGTAGPFAALLWAWRAANRRGYFD